MDQFSNLPRSFVSALLEGSTEAELSHASYWLRDADFSANSPHFAVMLLRAVVANKRDTAEKIAGAWIDESIKQVQLGAAQ